MKRILLLFALLAGLTLGHWSGLKAQCSQCYKNNAPLGNCNWVDYYACPCDITVTCNHYSCFCAEFGWFFADQCSYDNTCTNSPCLGGC